MVTESEVVFMMVGVPVNKLIVNNGVDVTVIGCVLVRVGCVGRIKVGVNVKVGAEVGKDVSVNTGALVSVLTVVCCGTVKLGMAHAKLMINKIVSK
jgi:hypothetical protein